MTAAYDMRVFNDGPDYAAVFFSSLMRTLHLRSQFSQCSEFARSLAPLVGTTIAAPST